MEKEYEINSKVFKVLGDSNRLKIIDLLARGEKCACEILRCFDFTQPTLSHHMKILIECGLVDCRKEGTWNFYRLNSANLNNLVIFLMKISTETSECNSKINQYNI
jgi:ArsR family transcriptional regulator